MPIDPLFIIEMLAIGVVLGLITVPFILRKKIGSALKADLEKYGAARQALKDKFRAAIAARIERQKAAQPKPIASARQAALIAEQMVIMDYVERAVTWLYISWHRIQAWGRFLLCIPFAGVFIYAFFKISDPVFLAAQSFTLLGLLKYIAQLIVVFETHTVIYLLMSRHRFWVSATVAIIAAVIVPFCIWLKAPNLVEANLFEILAVASFHFAAVMFLRRVWLMINNSAGATFRLLGFEFIATALCIAIVMIFIVFAVLTNSSPETMLMSSIYQYFEPFMQKIMTPLHLHIGDLLPESVMLIILLLIWSSALFVLGGYLILANYKSLVNFHKA